MKKKQIIGTLIVVAIIVAGVAGGTIYKVQHKKEEAIESANHKIELAKEQKLEIQNKKELKEEKVKLEEVANSNFKTEINKAFKEMDNDNSTVNYIKTINSIDTANLSESNLAKLNNMKITEDDMAKVCKAEVQIENKKYKEAKEILSGVDTQKLVKDGLMPRSAFESMDNQISEGIKESEGMTAKQLLSLAGYNGTAWCGEAYGMTVGGVNVYTTTGSFGVLPLPAATLKNLDKKVKLVEVYQGCYAYLISYAPVNSRTTAYYFIKPDGTKVTWSDIIIAFKNGTLNTTSGLFEGQTMDTYSGSSDPVMEFEGNYGSGANCTVFVGPEGAQNL